MIAFKAAHPGRTLVAGLVLMVQLIALGQVRPGAAQALESYRQAGEWTMAGRPSRVVTAPNGDIYTMTDAGVDHRTGTGVVIGTVNIALQQELAVDGSGSLYGTTNHRTVAKFGAIGNLLWSDYLMGVPIASGIERAPHITGVAWDPASSRLQLPYDMGAPEGGSQFRVLEYVAGGAKSVGLTVAGTSDTYGDIAAADGKVFLLNRTRATVEIYRNGLPEADLPLAEPAERIAVAPDGSVFALSRRQWVYKYRQTGAMLAVWEALDPTPDPGSDSVAVDLTVDASGRVFVADPNRRRVRIYDLDPDPSAPPPPPPAPPSFACQMVPDKFAAPTYLRLGQTTKVTLRLGGDCPELAERLDIAVVVDISDSMNNNGKIAAARAAVEAFVLGMNLERDQVALVTFQSTPSLVRGLTQDGGAIIDAARGLTAFGGTDIAAGIDTAVAELTSGRRRADAKPVIVLMTDGKPFNSTGAATLAAAERGRYMAQPAACRTYGTCGITLYSIGLGDVDQGLLRIVASSPELYFYAPGPAELEGVYRNVARRISASVLLKTVTIVDTIPGNMTYVTDSAVPTATYDGTARTLTWTWAPVPFQGIEMTYWLEPQEVGEWPTNVIAIYDGTDGLDQPQAGEFPIPHVIVVDETPTPPPTSTSTPTAPATTPPPTPTLATATPTFTGSPSPSPSPTLTPTASATTTPTVPTVVSSSTPTLTVAPSPTVPGPSATPTTPVPSATPSSRPERYKAYIPIVYNNACFKRYTDAVLVIDASTTMLRKNEFGRTKLEAAKAAASMFLDHLWLTPDRDGRHDQASIVWFNRTSAVEQPLTNDRLALEAALGRISPVEGSRIDLGIRSGHAAALDAATHNLANRPVMVVLTDGIPNWTTFEEVFAAADEAKLAGILVYTVGHGLDVEDWALRRIATDEEKFYYSPSDADLSGIYNEIAGQVVCR